jgi:regulator of replication initiation timing
MSMTKVDNEHEQLVSMLNQLLDEREILSRENEYLKAKLNESVLMETIKEMKKERDLLFKLLSNLTINKDEQFKILKHSNKEK